MTHFQSDARHVMVVEDAPDMETAEREADKFLELESGADEGGCSYIRIKSSGIPLEGKYYFEVVVVAGDGNIV